MSRPSPRAPAVALAASVALVAAIGVASCGTADVGEACVGEGGADCLSCCAETTPTAYAALVRKLECTCVADPFCASECGGEPTCSTPPATLADACTACLAAATFTNCGASANFECMDQEGCRDAITCLESCSG